MDENESQGYNYDDQGKQNQPNNQDARKKKKKGSWIDYLRTGYRILRFIPGSSSPLAWTIVLFVLSIIILVVMGSGSGFFDYTPTQFTPDEPPTAEVVPGITITVISYGSVTGRGGLLNQVTNDEDIIYEITVDYSDTAIPPPPARDLIIIRVPIPLNAGFQKADPSCRNPISIPGEALQIIECPLGLFEENPAVFEVQMSPLQNDVYIVNTVRAAVLDPSGRTSLLGAQESIDCINSTNKTCPFTMDNLYTYLKYIDPQNANFWFYKIIPCESSFSPTNKIDLGNHASYGLLNLQSRDGNPSPISWQEQIETAVKYNNNMLGGGFSYWSCNN